MTSQDVRLNEGLWRSDSHTESLIQLMLDLNPGNLKFAFEAMRPIY